MIKKTRTLTGTVISKPGLKTIKVLVEEVDSFPKYKKVFTRKKKYLVHDEQEKAKIGDQVLIISSKPISKKKNFKIAKIIK
jgi:small subunit ribosomal protein S17